MDGASYVQIGCVVGLVLIVAIQAYWMYKQSKWLATARESADKWCREAADHNYTAQEEKRKRLDSDARLNTTKEDADAKSRTITALQAEKKELQSQKRSNRNNTMSVRIINRKGKDGTMPALAVYKEDGKRVLETPSGRGYENETDAAKELIVLNDSWFVKKNED